VGNILWEFAFGSIGLSIDSDNNNGFEPPDESSIEERLEAGVKGDREKPGKRMEVNITVVENQPGNQLKPDYVNFTGTPDNHFVPIILEIYGDDEPDLPTQFIKFHYFASDPDEVEEIGDPEIECIRYVPAEGSLRIWRKDGTEVRSPKRVRLGETGDFIPNNQLIQFNALGISNSQRKVTLYVEAIGVSEEVGDQLIIVKRSDQ